MSRLRWFLLIAMVAPGATPLRAQLVQPNVIVSVRDQKLMLLDNGGNAAVYPVSTSKFGLGDRWGSMATPLGTLQVAQKIGDRAPTDAVFTVDSSKPGAEKASVTPLPPKTSVAPAKKSDATAWLRNARA